ncbi:GNAT family N-acetyltransferase [Vagococcus salmoninarum]|uniref:GNAT family N-acetyltransferase n=1 Tax=Vagococcus salmoninarum TaxID=2739 RepID=UPI0028D18D82|nr:GNAT family N-acetyltransferase [Vagococcus salmoninarum]
MTDYQLIKNYQTNPALKESFMQLAKATFDLDFTTWSAGGFWQSEYLPYGFIAENEVVANASLNKMTLVIADQEYQAIQIGTVMTKASHRNQGLAKQLIQEIIKDYQGSVDLIYLFANETVLDFYPKLGFQGVSEFQGKLFLAETQLKRTPSELIQLDPNKTEDLECVFKVAKNRQMISQNIGVKDNHNLLMFYFLLGFPENTYYLAELETVVMMEQVDKTLHVFDLIYQGEQAVSNLLEKLITEEIEEVILYFSPQEIIPNLHFTEITNDDDCLFVRGKVELLQGNHLFPLTSHC